MILSPLRILKRNTEAESKFLRAYLESYKLPNKPDLSDPMVYKDFVTRFLDK